MMPKPDIQFDALGTHWWIELLGNTNQRDIENKLRSRASSFENDYSRFLPTSYIGRLNADKKLHNPSPELLRMLTFARDMYEASEGIFNISVGGTLVQLGYGKSERSAKLHATLWSQIEMNEREITIPEDIELDFGGFGKGWLIDELGALLKNEGCEYFVINGGGDILVNAPEPIEFALEHPLNDSLKIGTTRIEHGALAVSSSVKRVWKKGAKSHHHIIDPRLEASSDSYIIATYIRADSALIADTMATILLIEPSLREKLTEKYGLKTILLDKSSLAKN